MASLRTPHPSRHRAAHLHADHVARAFAVARDVPGQPRAHVTERGLELREALCVRSVETHLARPNQRKTRENKECYALRPGATKQPYEMARGAPGATRSNQERRYKQQQAALMDLLPYHIY